MEARNGTLEITPHLTLFPLMSLKFLITQFRPKKSVKTVMTFSYPA